MPIWASPERYARGLAQLRAQANGRDLAAAVVLPSLIDGTVDDTRRYLSRRYGTEFSTHAIENYCLTGPPAQCAERVLEYVEAGARYVILHPAVEPAHLIAQIELGVEVMHAAAR